MTSHDSYFHQVTQERRHDDHPMTCQSILYLSYSNPPKHHSLLPLPAMLKRFYVCNILLLSVAIQVGHPLHGQLAELSTILGSLFSGLVTLLWPLYHKNVTKSFHMLGQEDGAT